MRRNNTYKMKRKAGFTLVEMIVVLVMLAVLAAVAVPTYTSYVDSNKAKQCEVERKAIASRLEEMQTMQVTGSDSAADTTKYAEYVASQECPAGGAYTFIENTIVCSHPEHGETTVLLKTDIGVTAKASTQTEAPTEAPEPTSPPANNSTPLEPKFEIAVTREFESMEVSAEQTLTASVRIEENCIASNTYEWGIPSNFEVIGDRNGANIKIRAISAGTLCNISCSSSAAVTEGDPISASANTQVTVNEPKSLAVSLAPSSLNLMLGEEGKDSRELTANVVASGYNSYVCNWMIEAGKEAIASVTKVTDDQRKASVTGLAEGTAIVTCTVIPDDDVTAAQTATATVTVRKETVEEVHLPDEVLIPAWTISGDGSINSHLYGGNEDPKYDPRPVISVPDGGYWSCSDGKVTCRKDYAEWFKYDAQTNLWDGEDGYIEIQDGNTGTTYPLTYNYKGKTYTTRARVVYPIRSFVQHQYNGQEGMYNGAGADGEMPVSTEKDLWLNFQPFCTTDGPIQWDNKTEDIVSIIETNNEQEESRIKIRALKPGTATIEAHVWNEFEQKEYRYPYTVKVKYQKAKSINYDDITLLNLGDTQNIAEIMHLTPTEGLDLSDLQYVVDSNNVVDASNGVFTAKQYGTAQVRITVKKAANEFQESWEVSNTCTITVGNPSAMEPTGAVFNDMHLLVGESATATLAYLEPKGASAQGVTFSYTNGFVDNNGVHIVEVSSEGVVKGLAVGRVSVYMDMNLNGSYKAGTHFDVYVSPTQVEVGGLKLDVTPWKDLRNLIIQQNETPGSVEIPLTQVYAEFENGGWNYNVYILRPGATLPWEEDYDPQMSFGDYIAKHDVFIKVNTNSWEVTENPNQYVDISAGKVIKIGGAYYVYTGNSRKFDENWTTEADLLANGFVKIS